MAKSRFIERSRRVSRYVVRYLFLRVANGTFIRHATDRERVCSKENGAFAQSSQSQVSSSLFFSLSLLMSPEVVEATIGLLGN